MARAILIPANRDDISEVDLDLGDFSAMAEVIGARYIEFVRINDPHHYMIVDETGRLTGERANARASLLYPAPICGDVLIVGWNPDIDPMDEDTMEIQATDLPLIEVPSWLLENERRS